MREKNWARDGRKLDSSVFPRAYFSHTESEHTQFETGKAIFSAFLSDFGVFSPFFEHAGRALFSIIISAGL